MGGGGDGEEDSWAAASRLYACGSVSPTHSLSHTLTKAGICPVSFIQFFTALCLSIVLLLIELFTAVHMIFKE